MTGNLRLGSLGLVASVAFALATVRADAAPLVAPARDGGSAGEARWTDENPDAMIDDSLVRATGGKTPDAVAAMATIVALDDRASFGHAKKALEAIAGAAALPTDAREEAKVMARVLAADEGSDAGVLADRALGVVTNLALVGPFRDTGGGLNAKDGPEARGTFADMKARYAWGTVDVGWRPVPPRYATAQGIPLDLFIHPRKESCSIVASKITLPSAGPIVLHLAATGTARLMFDEAEVARSEDVHTKALFDRLAVKVTANAGPHLLGAKVCSGALADEGHIRLRVTDANGAPIDVPSSAELFDPAPSKQKQKVDPVVTPLATALDLAHNASPDAVLDAAVTRTLGGTDDAKSPRAQGLLDTITQKKGLSADSLAMAGWIAPSGANRSGWLNGARDRADDAHDTKAHAFAERRLIAERLNARMADWALATFRGAKIDGKDNEALLLGVLIDETLGTDALRVAALARVETAYDRDKSGVPTGLVEAVTRLAASYKPELYFDAFEELGRRGRAGGSYVNASLMKGADAVGRAAADVFQGSLSNADEALGVVANVVRTGNHALARKLYGQLCAWAPNRPEAWAGMANAIAVTAASGDHEQADLATQAALRRARELAPGEARYRAELELRAAANGDKDAAPPEDEHYIVPSQTILARRQGVPKTGAPDVADRELYWLRAVIMHPDNRVSMLIQYAREIVIAPRTEGELFEELPAEGDLTEILRARVHRKDGGTAFPTEEHNEGTRPRIRWPNLMPGDVVEVAIRTWTSTAVGGRGDAPFYFLDYAGAPSTHPLLYNEVDVESSPAHPIYVDVLNGGAHERTESDANGRHVVRLVWDKPAVLPEEPLAPQMTEVAPLIVGSTFKSWTDFRAWYQEAVKGFTEPDDEVRRRAAELTKGKTTREAKLKAIFDFVADDIRYVNYVSGEWWLPNRPQQLLARREGDCDDKAILLITLLRAVGIEAQEVMVQTRLTGQPSVLLAKNAAVPMFDHGIAFLPNASLPGGGTYLDATSPQSRLGPLPSMDARAVALRMEGPAQIVHLPASSPEDHGADVTWTIRLNADGSGDLVGEELHTGDGAFFLRSYLSQPDARAQYVEDNLVAGWFPTVEVDKNVDFKGELKNGQAWVGYKAHSDGFARHEDKELVVPVSPSAPMASQIAPLVERKLPVVLPPNLAPSHQLRTIRVVAPAGYKWGELPPGGDENSDFGRAHLEIARDAKDARTVVIKRGVTWTEDHISPEKYTAWRAWVQRVDALMHKGVRLLKDDKAAPANSPTAPVRGAR